MLSPALEQDRKSPPPPVFEGRGRLPGPFSRHTPRPWGLPCVRLRTRTVLGPFCRVWLRSRPPQYSGVFSWGVGGPLPRSSVGKKSRTYGCLRSCPIASQTFEGRGWSPGRRPPCVRLCATPAHTPTPKHTGQNSALRSRKRPVLYVFPGCFSRVCARLTRTTGFHAWAHTRPGHNRGVFSAMSRPCGVAHPFAVLFRPPPACLMRACRLRAHPVRMTRPHVGPPGSPAFTPSADISAVGKGCPPVHRAPFLPPPREGGIPSPPADNQTRGRP